MSKTKQIELKKNLKSSFEKKTQKNMNEKVFVGMKNSYLEWNCIIWNEIEIFRIKMNKKELSLWGMSLSIEKIHHALVQSNAYGLWSWHHAIQPSAPHWLRCTSSWPSH